MIIMTQSIDPKKLSNKEVSRRDHCDSIRRENKTDVRSEFITSLKTFHNICCIQQNGNTANNEEIWQIILGIKKS